MSLRAISHLYNQGLYFLRITVYTEKEDFSYYAHPYSVESPDLGKKEQTMKLRPAYVREDISAFCSTVFMVRYSEQEVELNDICKFRTEIDVDLSYLDTNFKMDCELMFSDLKGLGGPDKFFSDPDKIGAEATFECVAVKTFCITRMLYGLYEFVPLVFEDAFASITNMTFHSILIDYRFRVKSMRAGTDDRFNIYSENGVMVKPRLDKDGKPIAEKHKKKKMHSDIIEKQWVPNKAAEFLFCDEFGNMPERLEADEVNMLHREYTNIIKALYDKLASKYNQFISEVQQVDRSILFLPDYSPPLKAPYDNNIVLSGGPPNMIDVIRITKNTEISFNARKIQAVKPEVMGGSDDEDPEEEEVEPGMNVAGIEEMENDDVDVDVDAHQEPEVVTQRPIKMTKSPVQGHEEDVVDEEELMKEPTPPVDADQHENPELPQGTTPAISHDHPDEEVKTAEKKSKFKRLIKGAKSFKDKVSSKLIAKPVKEEVKKEEQRFSDRVDLNKPATAACEMLIEINLMASSLFELWNYYATMIKVIPDVLVQTTQKDFYEKVNERWGESIFREVIESTDFSNQAQEQVGEQHNDIANKTRKNEYYRGLTPLPIQDESLFPKAKEHPIVFEECYCKDPEVYNSHAKHLKTIKISNLIQQNSNEIHLIVLCHGFQGNSEDLRLFRNNILQIFPEALMLSSQANESQTEGDIEDMGLSLANEVSNYIDQFINLGQLAKLSFVGHSLGGLIIRASLPFLEQFKDKMTTYMSFSTPHLGYTIGGSKLVSAGMWVLKKWNKSVALTQMSMTDQEDPTETVLYKLSEMPGFQWFKNIVLLSSYQDSYAPFESAHRTYLNGELTE